MLALAYAVASRLAYVLYIGIALRRQERSGAGDFRRFRRIAAILMNNDAAAFILLCVVTRDTVVIPGPRAAAIAVGLALIVVGLGTKLWAARTLGADAYYWGNFFEAPAPGAGPVATGPYRFAANPMYTIGYLQTYGLALVLASGPGLVVAVIAQAAILVFYWMVEKPHFERLHRG